MNIQRLLVMTMALLCAACAGPRAEFDLLSGEIKNYPVVLTPNRATNVLDVLTEPQGWEKAGKQKGWVGFDRDQAGTITFILNAQPAKPVCTDDATTTAEWVISKVELSKNGNPQSQKGHNFGRSQTGWIEDAFPQMEPANGEIKADGIGTNMVVVHNLNNNKGNQTAYYQITAKRCSDGHEMKTDPGIGNRGK